MDFPFMFANLRIYFLKMSSKMREKKNHTVGTISKANRKIVHYLSNPTLTYIYNPTLTYIYITSQIPPSHTYTTLP